MGTRSDFYVKEGDNVVCVRFGSFDGYHWHERVDLSAVTTREAFEAMIVAEGSPKTWEMKWWPWPWETSHITDYAYLFNGDHVEVYAFGHGPLPPYDPDGDDGGQRFPRAAWMPEHGGRPTRAEYEAAQADPAVTR